ncbi:hypothetical protein I6A84_11205 [Frankia sp. CNm7]|uniref:Uncharacterized protein n=1 Tax=Frankia nepalensis TaxID=1836974 RepID=A0A937RHG8_9ACTN|nr:DUF5990 family protein [Frankia nepalensis]MBL7498336.1 hypothetical protein [Frankia nepalensis]MBL7514984.1 hypothetical protein [Frankia nepalensis]MBL7518663.1 hypothetical protein [Frankia nepalensis]MBL7628939.1 hypothetical protein [Frankia nepalensis]
MSEPDSPPELVIVVTVHDVQDHGGTLEYGLQSSKGQLDAGTPTGDGGIRYECRARARSRPDGTLTCRGEFLHGPTSGRFLYISFRAPGGAQWVRRTKIMLPDSISGDARRLSARVLDVGRSRVLFEQDWLAEPDAQSA